MHLRLKGVANVPENMATCSKTTDSSHSNALQRKVNF